jgi:hypothetical protein
MRKVHVPVEILSLDLDITHAIAGLSLALLPVRLFLLLTHLGCVLAIVASLGGGVEERKMAGKKI